MKKPEDKKTFETGEKSGKTYAKRLNFKYKSYKEHLSTIEAGIKILRKSKIIKESRDIIPYKS